MEERPLYSKLIERTSVSEYMYFASLGYFITTYATREQRAQAVLRMCITDLMGVERHTYDKLLRFITLKPSLEGALDRACELAEFVKASKSLKRELLDLKSRAKDICELRNRVVHDWANVGFDNVPSAQYTSGVNSDMSRKRYDCNVTAAMLDAAAQDVATLVHRMSDILLFEVQGHPPPDNLVQLPIAWKYRREWLNQPRS